MGFFLVTNNPRVATEYRHLKTYFQEGGLLAVFARVRDLVHRGHRLLTHPLSGSLKPGRIPYKTVFLTGDMGDLDLASLAYIEEAIAAYHKSRPLKPSDWPPEILADYARIDLSQVEAALENLEAERG